MPRWAVITLAVVGIYLVVGAVHGIRLVRRIREPYNAALVAAYARYRGISWRLAASAHTAGAITLWPIFYLPERILRHIERTRQL